MRGREEAAGAGQRLACAQHIRYGLIQGVKTTSESMRGLTVCHVNTPQLCRRHLVDGSWMVRGNGDAGYSQCRVLLLSADRLSGTSPAASGMTCGLRLAKRGDGLERVGMRNPQG